VVKINFHGGKNQFSPVTRASFRTGYACTGNALIWLVGIRGKSCFGGQPCRENCVYLIGLCGLESRTVARKVKVY